MFYNLETFRSFNRVIYKIHRWIQDGGSGANLLHHSAYTTPDSSHWLFFTFSEGKKQSSATCRFRSQVGIIGANPLYYGSDITPIGYPRGNNPQICLFKDSPLTATILECFNRHKRDSKGISWHLNRQLVVDCNANLYPKLGRIEKGALDINGNYIGMKGNPPEMEGGIILPKRYPHKRFDANNPNDTFRKSIAQYRYYGVKTILPIFQVNQDKLNKFVKDSLKLSNDIKVINYAEQVIKPDDENYWISFLNYIFPNRVDKDLTFIVEGIKYRLDYKNKRFINLSTNESLIQLNTPDGILCIDINKSIKDIFSKRYKPYIFKFLNKVKNKQFKEYKFPSNIRFPIPYIDEDGNQTIRFKYQCVIPYNAEIKNYTFADDKNCYIYKEGQMVLENRILADNPSVFNLIFPKGKHFHLCQKNLTNKSPEDDAITTNGTKTFWNTVDNTMVELIYWNRAIMANEANANDILNNSEYLERMDRTGNLNSRLVNKYIEYPIFKNFIDLNLQDSNDYTIIINMNFSNKQQKGKLITFRFKPMFKVNELTLKAPIQIGYKQELEEDLQENTYIDPKLYEIEFSPFLYFFKSIFEPTKEFKYPYSNSILSYDSWYFEPPEELEFDFWYKPQHFLDKYKDGIIGILVEYESNGKIFTDVIKDMNILEFTNAVSTKVNKLIKHLPTVPFYFKDFQLCEKDHRVRETVWVPVPLPFPPFIIPIPITTYKKAFQLVHTPLSDGDYFYNVSDKYTNLFFRANNLRIDYYDRFENPNFTQDRGDDKLLAKISNKRKIPSIYRKRELGANLKEHQRALRFLERPITNTAPTGFKYVSPNPNERLNTKHTENELTNSKLIRQNYTDYIDYMTSSNPQYISKYWYKQSFSLIHMFNPGIRKVKHMIKMAYDYIDFVINLYNVPINTWNNVLLLVPHRIPSPVMRKSIRIRKYKLSEYELNQLNKKYICELKSGILTCYNKSKGFACELDMESYIPNYSKELGTSQSALQAQSDSIFIKLNSIWRFSSTKNVIVGDNTTRGLISIVEFKEDWKDFFEDTNIYPKDLGGFEGRKKPNLSFFAKFQDFLEQQPYNKLLALYNEINNTNIISKDRSSLFQIKNEFSSLDADRTHLIDGRNTIKSPFVPKFISTGLDNATFSEPFGTDDNKVCSMDADFTEASLYNPKTIMYLHQKNSWHNEKNNILDKSQYFYIDSGIQENISKVEIIDFLIEEAIKALNEHTSYITISNKYIQMYNKGNSTCFKLLDEIGEYSFRRLIYDTFIVVPDKVYLDFNTSNIQPNVIRGFKNLYEKSLQITKLDRQSPNGVYMYHYLPLYADFYKKLSYANKVFIKKLYCNVESWGVSIVEEEYRQNSWVDFFKAVIKAVVVITMAIILSSTGLFQGWQLVILWINTTFTVISIMLQGIAAITTSSSLRVKLIKLSKAVSLAGTVINFVSMFIDLGSAIASNTTKLTLDSAIASASTYLANISISQVLTILNFGLSVVGKLVDVYIDKQLNIMKRNIESKEQEINDLTKQLDNLNEDLVSIGALAKYPLNIDKFNNLEKYLSVTDLDRITYEGIDSTFDIFNEYNYMFD